MAHVSGQSRYQSTLFPEVLDEVIAGDDPVRVIDAFVETLDLGQLGFAKAEAAATGRPPYAPGNLLKLYVYGYLNRVRSSRRLEAEAQRNVQVMWLINRLRPAFKTIADFRKDHAHPFGTTKWLMGYPRFPLRGLIKAKAELALGVLSYNLKRAITILGVPQLLQALQPA